MIQLDQLKEQYRKDLYSFRKLERYKFKGEKGARSGYVIAIIPAKEVVDEGFWNNDRLVEQFSYQNVKSTGYRAVDVVRDVALESEAEKKVQKASEESEAKLIFYAEEKKDLVYADLVFHNQSKNRDLSKMALLLGDEEGVTMENQKTYQASSGKTSFEDVAYLTFGSFSEFREHFMGKEITLMFSWEKDENDEAKDFISLTFNLKVFLADYYAVNFIVEGSSWGLEKTEELAPFLGEKLTLNKRRMEIGSSLNQVNHNASKAKKGGCLVSIFIFIAYFSAFEITSGNLSDGLMALFVIGMIIPSVIGAVIAKKKAQKGKEGLSGDVAAVDEDEEALEKKMVEAGI